MGLKIEILCSSPKHPFHPWLAGWIESRGKSDNISIVYDPIKLSGGDLLFLIAVTEVVSSRILKRFAYNAVIHSSDLPEGRGWSPQVWALINGATEITVSALVAAKSVDSGPIWTKQRTVIPTHALYDEINERLYRTWVSVMTRVCDMVVGGESPRPQSNGPATYWPRRSPADSKINPSASIASQFNLMRVCDPYRYPAYFELNGHKYIVRLEKYFDGSVSNDGSDKQPG